MPASTKKAGSAGRFGARYGALARKQVATIERVQRARHPCQKCGAEAVKRVHTGIWACRKCGHTFAGGAYVPRTGSGHGATKAIKGVGDKLEKGAAEDAADARAARAADEAEES